jgi:hypothetical protein
VKLKVLNALYNGRHCVANEMAVKSTGLEAACHIGDDASTIRDLIRELYMRPFTAEDVALRKELLGSKFNNAENVQRLIQWIW